MSYGEMIRRFREAKGWRQRDLGDEIGVTDSYVTFLETERRIPSAEFVGALARALELPETDREALIAAVEQAKSSQENLRRNRRVRAFRAAAELPEDTAGASSVTLSDSGTASSMEQDEQVAWLLENPDARKILEALRNNPRLMETVKNMVEMVG